MARKGKNGFTLVEAIASLAILGIISVACLGIISSAFSTKDKGDAAVREQVMLRQALLTVNRGIRKNPVDADPNSHYTVNEDGILRRISDNSTIAKDIADFKIDVSDGKATIYIKSVSGQEVKTAIHLRVDV